MHADKSLAPKTGVKVAQVIGVKVVSATEARAELVTADKAV
jgi:hypothetical protein